MAKIEISIVTTTFNEAEIIADFLVRTQAEVEKLTLSYEILIVDDGSLDNTTNIIKHYMLQYQHLRLIVLSRNYGHEMAMTAGLEHARGQYVVQMDADLQHPPELISELINKIKQGYDVVYAARRHRKYESRLKRFLTKGFYAVAKRMIGFEISTDATNFRIMSRRVVDAIKKLKENNRHLILLYAYVVFKTTSIPFDTQMRAAGKSKYTYFKLIDLALDSIISFSQKPLRYMAIISLCISLTMALYAGFIFFQTLLYQQQFAEGVASVILITSSLFSILFLFLSILSEYIGRILVESRNRPLYYVSEDIAAKGIAPP